MNEGECHCSNCWRIAPVAPCLRNVCDLCFGVHDTGKCPRLERPPMLRIAQMAVLAFHEKFGCSIGDKPGFRGNEGPAEIHHKGNDRTRASLITEEALETTDAINAGNFPEAVDGLCDLIYVCLGTAVTWGVDLSPIFQAVHNANMAKEGGATRPDGKILKPEGWTPPDVRRLLKEQGWTE